jgi:hypothetical protein
MRTNPLDSDGHRAIAASGTAATREPSRNLRSVSALRASVGLSQGAHP